MLLLFGAAESASAQTTYCVNTTTCPPGGVVVPVADISFVTAAAASGDVIIVGPGIYPPFAVLSTNLTIQPETFGGTFTVDGLLTPGIPQVSPGRCVEIVGAGSLGALIDGMEVVNGTHGTIGGGIYIQDSDPVLSRVRVHGNSAPSGGGIAIVGTSAAGNSPRIQNSEIYENEANDGAGIHLDDTEPEISATSIYRNGLTMPASNGGGVWGTNSGPRFLSCDIYENSASSLGGGVYVKATFEVAVKHTVRFEDSKVHDNDGGAGGGIYASGGLGDGAMFPLGLSIRATEIYANDSDYGGGLFATDHVTLSVDYARVDGNTAVYHGGGIYLDKADSTPFTNSQFSGNTAGSQGGALYLGTGDDGMTALHSMQFVLISGNAANDGAGMWVASDLLMIASTVQGNNAASNGGGLCLSASGPTGTRLNSSIFYGNTAGGATGYDKEIFNFGGTLQTLYLNWDNGTTPSTTPPPCTGPGCFNDPPPYVTGPGVSPWETMTGFYLSQTTPSNWIDGGDPGIPLTVPPYGTPAGPVGTTDPAHTPDASPLDVGFHYNGVPLPSATSSLVQSVSQISVSAGGSVTFTMTAPITAGPSTWVLGGSATGTYPGFYYGGVVVPLIFDGYSAAILNGGVLPHFGTLTGGLATTTLTIGPGQLPGSFAGTTLYHAFVVIDPTQARDPSSPLQLLFVP